ncbi:FecR family protein [Neptuniibacter sp.]|uniref:FecR family protein n=1 Tax=Neptuniibacter sp. TaxID=1962643 RepID=UPI003B5986F0
MIRILVVGFMLFSLTAGAVVDEKAGMVILSLGKNFAQLPDSDARALKRKSEIYNQDTVTTATNGRLQLRFTDGSRLSLGEGSQFYVEQYQYAEDAANEGRSVYKLLKGSLRTITGAISKADSDNYLLKTPIATIGVRGTDYELTICDRYCEDDSGDAIGLYGQVFEGIILAATESQTVDIISGTHFYISEMGRIQVSSQSFLNRIEDSMPDFKMEAIPAQDVSPKIEGNLQQQLDDPGTNENSNRVR